MAELPDDPYLAFAQSQTPDEDDPYLTFAKAQEPLKSPTQQMLASKGVSDAGPARAPEAPAHKVEANPFVRMLGNAFTAKPERPTQTPEEIAIATRGGRGETISRDMPNPVTVTEKKGGWISPEMGRKIDAAVPRAIPSLDKVVTAMPELTGGPSPAQENKSLYSDAKVNEIKSKLDAILADKSGDPARHNIAAAAKHDLGMLQAARDEPFVLDVLALGAQNYGASKDIQSVRENFGSAIEQRLSQLGITASDGKSYSLTKGDAMRQLVGGLVSLEMADAPLALAGKGLSAVSPTIAKTIRRLGESSEPLAKGVKPTLVDDPAKRWLMEQSLMGQGRMAVQMGGDAASRGEPVLPAVAEGLVQGAIAGPVLGAVGPVASGARTLGKELLPDIPAHLLRGAEKNTALRLGAEAKTLLHGDPHRYLLREAEVDDLQYGLHGGLGAPGAETPIAKRRLVAGVHTDALIAYVTRNQPDVAALFAEGKPLPLTLPDGTPNYVTRELTRRIKTMTPEVPKETGLGAMGKVGAAGTLAAIAARKLGGNKPKAPVTDEQTPDVVAPALAVAGALATHEAAPLFRSRLTEALESGKIARFKQLPTSEWLRRLGEDQSVSNKEVTFVLAPFLKRTAQEGDAVVSRETLLAIAKDNELNVAIDRRVAPPRTARRGSNNETFVDLNDPRIQHLPEIKEWKEGMGGYGWEHGRWTEIELSHALFDEENNALSLARARAETHMRSDVVDAWREGKDPYAFIDEYAKTHPDFDSQATKEMVWAFEAEKKAIEERYASVDIDVEIIRREESRERLVGNAEKAGRKYLKAQEEAASVEGSSDRLAVVTKHVHALPSKGNPKFEHVQRTPGGENFRMLEVRWNMPGGETPMPGVLSRHMPEDPGVMAHLRVDDALAYEHPLTETPELKDLIDRRNRRVQEMAEIEAELADMTPYEQHHNPKSSELKKTWSTLVKLNLEQGKTIQRLHKELLGPDSAEKVYTRAIEIQSDPLQTANKPEWVIGRGPKGEKLDESVRGNWDRPAPGWKSKEPITPEMRAENEAEIARINEQRLALNNRQAELHPSTVRRDNREYYENRTQLALLGDKQSELVGENLIGTRTRNPGGQTPMPWDTQKEVTGLQMAALLRESAETESDGIAWSDATNRSANAGLPLKAGQLTYDQAAVSSAKRLMKFLGFDVEPVLKTFDFYQHWTIDLTPEMRAAIKRASFPLLAGVAMIGASADEAQAQDDPYMAFAKGEGAAAPVEGPHDRAGAFALGAGVLAAGVLGVSGARRGYGMILRELAEGDKRGLSPLAIAAMGYAMQEVPDQDYQDFGKGVMGLAAMKAIGSKRIAEAGGKVGQEILKSAKSWGAEGVIRAFSPEFLLDDAVVDALQKYRETVAKGRAKALELGKKLGDLSPAANRLVTDLMRGEEWEQNFSPDDMKAALGMATYVQQTMAEMGREKLAREIISPAQFAASGGENYLPRAYAYHEARRLNPAGLERDRTGGGDAIRIGEQKSRVLDAPVRDAQAALDNAEDGLAKARTMNDTTLEGVAQEKVNLAKSDLEAATQARDTQRHKLGEIRESSYLTSYGLEKGWSSIGAAQLMETVHGIPGVIHPEWKAAFDEFHAAKQAYDLALDPSHRNTLRDQMATSELRVREAQKKVSALSTRRYEKYPEGSQRFVREQEMATAELGAANTERLDLQRQIREAGSQPDRAAAKLEMEAAQARMATVSNNFQQKRGLFGGSSEYVQLPTSKGLGALSGAVVQRELAMAVDGLPELKAIGPLMRTWKQIKTVFNPGTHLGNVMSNSVMWHMAGVSMTHQSPWLAAASKDMLEYGAATKRLAELGVLGVNSITEPAQGMMRGSFGPNADVLLALRKSTTPETAKVLEEQGVRTLGERLRDRGHTKTARAVEMMEQIEGPDTRPAGTSALQYQGLGIRKFGKDMKRVYENEDNVFRVAAYLQATAPVAKGGQGLAHEAALKIARDDLINFRSNSPLMALARSTVAPFVLYPAKAIPTFTRHLIDHPERWITVSATLLAINEIAQEQAGKELGDADIPKRERKSGFGTLVPDVIQMPFGRSRTGGIPAMDMTRWTPVSALTTGAPPGTTAGRLGLPGIVAGSGPWSDVFNLLNNKDAWTDRPLLTAEDDIANPRSWGKVGERVADIALPAIAGFQRRRLTADIQRDDPQAQIQDVLGAAGLRPRYYQPGEGARRDVMDVQQTIRDIKSDTKGAVRKSLNPAYSREQVEEARKRADRAIKNLIDAQRHYR